MMKNKLLLNFFLLFVIFLNSCAFSAGPVSSIVLHELKHQPKTLVLLSDGPFVDDMVMALTAEGFKVTGIPLPGKTFESGYGIRFKMELGQYMCLSGAIAGDATLTVVDLQSGDTVAVIKQWAANGPCEGGFDTAYPGIASELNKLWTSSKL